MERERRDCDGPDRALRILRVELDTLAGGSSSPAAVRPWAGSTPGIDRVGRLSGVGLAAALLHEQEVAHPGSKAPLVLAVGDCVRRGIPTAARACVASRAPLT